MATIVLVIVLAAGGTIEPRQIGPGTGLVAIQRAAAEACEAREAMEAAHGACDEWCAHQRAQERLWRVVQRYRDAVPGVRAVADAAGPDGDAVGRDRGGAGAGSGQGGSEGVQHPGARQPRGGAQGDLRETGGGRVPNMNHRGTKSTKT